MIRRYYMNDTLFMLDTFVSTFFFAFVRHSTLSNCHIFCGVQCEGLTHNP